MLDFYGQKAVKLCPFCWFYPVDLVSSCNFLLPLSSFLQSKSGRASAFCNCKLNFFWFGFNKNNKSEAAAPSGLYWLLIQLGVVSWLLIKNNKSEALFLLHDLYRLHANLAWHCTGTCRSRSSRQASTQRAYFLRGLGSRRSSCNLSLLCNFPTRFA